MIYVDSLRRYPNCGLPYTSWCHMATDDDDLSALHTLARRIGLDRAWFPDKPGTPHYDLTPTKRTQAATSQQHADLFPHQREEQYP